MVQRCVEMVEEMANQAALNAEYVALMECLRLNTDGKIYVENERARLTLRLALLKEKNGILKILKLKFRNQSLKTEFLK